MLRGPWLKARKSSKLVGRGMGREGSRPLKNPGLFSPYHPSKTREIVSMGWGLVAYGFLQLTGFGPWAEATCTYIDTGGIQTVAGRAQ